MKNSIEEDIEILEKNIKSVKENADMAFFESDEDYCFFKAVEHILSEYKKALKEKEELTISNKEIDKECNRLEKKEVELINENEHYKDLIYALETYYDITEEDLEKCMKNDR